MVRKDIWASNKHQTIDDLAGPGKNNTSYRPFTSLQVLKLESLVGKVQAVLENEYLKN